MENNDDDLEYQEYKKRLFEFLDKSIAFDKQTQEMREKEYSADELCKMVENTNKWAEDIGTKITYIDDNKKEKKNK